PARAGRRPASLVRLVPQTPGDLLYLNTVSAECAAADIEASAAPGTTAAIVHRLAPTVALDRHPNDLSEGQRLAVVLAIQLAQSPQVLLLDEPTRGLDYAAKEALVDLLQGFVAQGPTARSVIVSTHDV